MKDTKKSGASKTKVRETQVDEKFIDDDSDKRLIVFVAAAILIIVGTIIGLLVGCNKETEDEPKKPIDDIVVPEKDGKDKKEDKEAYNDVVRPLPVVRKVTSKSKTKKTTQTTEEETEESTTHNVTFYINGEKETVEIKSEEDIEKYAPKGYTNCEFYTDEELTEKYDLEEKLSEDKNLYLSCELITYSVVYEPESNNPDTYTVEDSDTPLEAPTSEMEFGGWYTEPEFTTLVDSLNKDIVDYADENNTIYLYAMLTEKELTEGETEEDPTVDEMENTEGEENLEGTPETIEGEENKPEDQIVTGEEGTTPTTNEEESNETQSTSNENNDEGEDDSLLTSTPENNENETDPVEPSGQNDVDPQVPTETNNEQEGNESLEPSESNDQTEPVLTTMQGTNTSQLEEPQEPTIQNVEESNDVPKETVVEEPKNEVQEVPDEEKTTVEEVKEEEKVVKEEPKEEEKQVVEEKKDEEEKPKVEETVKEPEKKEEPKVEEVQKEPEKKEEPKVEEIEETNENE